MLSVRLFFIIAALVCIAPAQAEYVTEHRCSFEEKGLQQLCGWIVLDGFHGEAGIKIGNNATDPFPAVDTLPGNESGSYFYYRRPDGYSNSQYFLNYPRQQFISAISFDYYITGVALLQVVKINIKAKDIVTSDNWSENLTAQWIHISVPFDPTNIDNDYGFTIASSNLDGELGEAPPEIVSTISLDNLTIQFTLPCDFDDLDKIGMFSLPTLDAFIIPLGEKSIVQFTAVSIACPNGTFFYAIDNNDHPELDDIFSIDSATGILTVDATGPNLVVEGVTLGTLTISVIVTGSDYLGTGKEPVKRKSSLIYSQAPTIIAESSPGSINVEPLQNFTYKILATSQIGSVLEYNNFQTNPVSLMKSISIEGSNVSGVITQSGLLDIIDNEQMPSFSVDISDIYGSTVSLTVDLLLSEFPPTFNKLHYTYEIEEEQYDDVIMGNFTVGDVNENDCDDLTVSLSSTMFDTSHYFSIISVGDIYNSKSLCIYLFEAKVPFNYEDQTAYDFNVTATDTNEQSTVATVTVNVLSVNECAPQFTQGHNLEVTADYMSSVGQLIYELTAMDTDNGPAGQLHYDITDGNDVRNFKLHQTSNGIVNIESNSEGLIPGTYNLTVVVSDGQAPVRTDTANLLVVVTMGDIDCSNENFGPPVIDSDGHSGVAVAVSSDATLECTYTSFPPSYPIQWTIVRDFINYPLLPGDSHYSYQDNRLIVHNVTSQDDNAFYQCNVSNPCGSDMSNYIVLSVVQIPPSVEQFRIKNGPYTVFVDLAWTLPPGLSTGTIDGYIIRLKEDNGHYQDYQDLPYAYPGALTYVSETSLTALMPGSNYSVTIVSYNSISGESAPQEITFKTNTSAPKLSLFEAISLTNHSLRVQWILEYTGGSSDLYMSIDVRSHEVKRRRRSIDSSDPVAMTFEVSVEDGMLLTPSLPFGRSYEIQGMITNQYGMAIHTVTAFIGYQDTVSCSFTSSPCDWTLGETGTIQLGEASQNKEPLNDATGNTMGGYALGSPPLPVPSNSIWNILSYPGLSYLCGYSFYYQVYNDYMRLTLVSASSLWNETEYWANDNGHALEWTLVEVPAGDIPIGTTSQDLVFVMESFDGVTDYAFAAIDEVSLHFCLPCDFSVLTNESFVITSPKNFTLFMRSYQELNIKTELNNCSNPILSYSIKEVIPTHLQSKMSIPNPRVGSIVLADVTPDMTVIGTEGTIQVTVEVSNANYKRNTLVLSKTITIPFIVSEKFENCSDLKSCQFENGLCDWMTGDQSKLTTDSMGNKYVLATIPDQNSKQNIEVMHRVINDSYCGINFLYKTQQGADLTVSVDGLGTLWSTSVEELVDTVTLQTNSSVAWHEVSLYVDVMGVEVMNGRRVVFEGVTGGQVSIDNVTLHPCVDCQAKECSCISCIQQCSSEPCQSGYYLSLEVNQCRPCPIGYYCTSWRSLPSPCPQGTFRNTTGAHTQDDCSVCPQGSYSLKTAALSCTDCPVGHYCSDASSLPVECPPGTYLNTTRAWKRDVCQSCPDDTYSLATGAGYCQECPEGYQCLEGGELPIASTSTQNFIAVIVGAVAGCVLLLSIAAVIVVYCYCRCKTKGATKRKRDTSVYKENFLVGLDSNSRYTSSGPKTGTVRTTTTIMSLKNERIDLQQSVGTIENEGFCDSNDDSSDEEMSERQNALLPLGKFTKEGTVSSLKSLGSTRTWSDINPFSASESHSNMSVLIELEDEKDHVWSALKQKKKNKSESQF